MNYISRLFITLVFFAAGCTNHTKPSQADIIIGNGQMPSMAKDSDANLHIVYGTGDSIMYSHSVDQGSTFSAPSLVALLPNLAASHMRGPQIALTKNGISIVACTNAGNIFSFNKVQNEKWVAGKQINDADTVAKEGFLSLSADGDNAYAVWLDLRDNNKNKIYGAASYDGGKTWRSNTMIYTSPDTTVCECCKPSVVVNGKEVHVMFRNWFLGNRDLYVISSFDNGNSFNVAKQLGSGHWKIDGCPMDGGGLIVNANGAIETVWRRDKTIFHTKAGGAEIAIGEGKSCTIDNINNKNFYAWKEDGNIIVTDGNNKRAVIGQGQLPVIKALNESKVMCVYELEKQIHARLISL